MSTSAQIFPLIHMIDGDGLLDIAPHLLIMLAMSVVSMTLGRVASRGNN